MAGSRLHEELKTTSEMNELAAEIRRGHPRTLQRWPTHARDAMFAMFQRRQQQDVRDITAVLSVLEALLEALPDAVLDEMRERFRESGWFNLLRSAATELREPHLVHRAYAILTRLSWSLEVATAVIREREMRPPAVDTEHFSRSLQRPTTASTAETPLSPVAAYRMDDGPGIGQPLSTAPATASASVDAPAAVHPIQREQQQDGEERGGAVESKHNGAVPKKRRRRKSRAPPRTTIRAVRRPQTATGSPESAKSNNRADRTSARQIASARTEPNGATRPKRKSSKSPRKASGAELTRERMAEGPSPTSTASSRRRRGKPRGKRQPSRPTTGVRRQRPQKGGSRPATAPALPPPAPSPLGPSDGPLRWTDSASSAALPPIDAQWLSLVSQMPAAATSPKKGDLLYGRPVQIPSREESKTASLGPSPRRGGARSGRLPGSRRPSDLSSPYSQAPFHIAEGMWGRPATAGDEVDADPRRRAPSGGVRVPGSRPRSQAARRPVTAHQPFPITPLQSPTSGHVAPDAGAAHAMLEGGASLERGWRGRGEEMEEEEAEEEDAVHRARATQQALRQARTSHSESLAELLRSVRAAVEPERR